MSFECTRFRIRHIYARYKNTDGIPKSKYKYYILQKFKGKHLQTNIDSQISAMAYLDLILRSVSEPALLRAFVKFFLDTEKFDGCRILDSLVDRISSPDPNVSINWFYFE